MDDDHQRGDKMDNVPRDESVEESSSDLVWLEAVNRELVLQVDQQQTEDTSKASWNTYSR